MFGSGTPNILKPLHNFFCGCDGNKQYKQKLNMLIEKKAKLSGVTVDEIVMEAIEGTISESTLAMRPSSFA